MTDKQQIYARLNVASEQLTAFCNQYCILELFVFGSILRDDFCSDSDIDLLVVFDPNSKTCISLMDLVGIAYQLEDMFGRKVDLIEKRSIIDSDNWIRRENILNTAQNIYESGRILSA